MQSQAQAYDVSNNRQAINSRFLDVLGFLLSIASFAPIVFPVFRSVLMFQNPNYTYHYFAADGFYYLAFAKSALTNGFYNLNGMDGTNGYHPLYLWLLVLLKQVASVSLEQAAVLIGGVSLLGTILVGRRIINRIAETSLHAIWMNLIFTILLCTSEFEVFFNGMETGLWVLGLFLVIWRMTDLNKSSKPLDFAIFGGCLLFCVMARLDSIVLFFPLLMGLVLLEKGLPSFKKTMITSLIVIVPLMGYLLTNYIFTNEFIPISGIVKGIFPRSIWENFILAFSKGVPFYYSKSILAFCALSTIPVFAICTVSDRLNRRILRLLNIQIVFFASWIFYSIISMLRTNYGEIAPWYFAPLQIFVLLMVPIQLYVASLLSPLRIIPVTAVAIFFVGNVFFGFSGSRKNLFERFEEMKKENLQIDENFLVDKDLNRPILVKQLVDSGAFNKFSPDEIFLDGTDGAFSYFTNFRTIHMKGMASNAEYAEFYEKRAHASRSGGTTARMKVEDDFRKKFNIRYQVNWYRARIDNDSYFFPENIAQIDRKVPEYGERIGVYIRRIDDGKGFY